MDAVELAAKIKREGKENPEKRKLFISSANEYHKYNS